MEKCAKVITMCGSLKFQKEMMEQAQKLELEGYCVLSVVYPTNEDKDSFTEEQFDILGKMHKQRIAMSDSIFVVNVDGYIGSSTKSEIEYARMLNKDILYLEEVEF